MPKTDAEQNPISATRIERNRFEYLHGEIEAGFVFAAAAVEYQATDPEAALTCRTEAEDCYSTSLKTTRQSGLTSEQRQRLEAMLQELRATLDRIVAVKRSPSAAA
jgi:hypothetical protein